MMYFTHALVRPPGVHFAKGLTRAGLGLPDVRGALAQHDAYCAALEACGLGLVRLAPDAMHPDATFVEDTAIVTARGALITRPGAESRRGEVEAVRAALGKFFPALAEIRGPGTLDGGDVCDAGGHFFIGLSERTNESGAKQLADWLNRLGYTAATVDIRGRGGLLHLKSGLAWLGEKKLVAVNALAERAEFHDYELMRVATDEEYAANCVNVNGTLLIARRFPNFENTLCAHGFKTLALEMSEFRKMDGGLSCLSLRW